MIGFIACIYVDAGEDHSSKNTSAGRNITINCNVTTISNGCKSEAKDTGVLGFFIAVFALIPLFILCVLCPCLCLYCINGQKQSCLWLNRWCNKPLGKLLKEFHISVVETVDHETVETHAKQYLDKFFEELSQHTNFCHGMDLMLAGSVAESFSLPFYPGNVLDYRHAIISDFDFMMSSKIESASFEENANVKYKVLCNEQFLDRGFVYLLDNETNERVSANLLKIDFKETALKMKPSDFEFQKSCFRRAMEIAYCSCLQNIEVEMNGPAITIISHFFSSYDFYFDITYSVYCNEWPCNISDWQKRP